MMPMMRMGMTVMRNPVHTYLTPSPATTVCQNPAPDLMPTAARNNTRPTSRMNRLADVVV